jgi:hypothetical protein
MAGVVNIILLSVLKPCRSVGCTDPKQKHSACIVKVEGIGFKKRQCRPTPHHGVIRVQKGVPFLTL